MHGTGAQSPSMYMVPSSITFPTTVACALHPNPIPAQPLARVHCV